MNTHKVNICYPLAGTTAEEIIVDAKAATEYKVDIAEWRADLFEGKEYKEVLEKIREVYEGPLIFTCRDLHDLNLYKTIGLSGLVDYMDIDIKELPEGSNLSFDACKLIVSKHTPDLPKHVEKELDELAKRSDMIKLAVTVKTKDGCDKFIKAVKKYKETHPDIALITTAMGEAGSRSRVMEYYGSCITYCRGRVATAVGQLSLEELREKGQMIRVENLYFKYSKGEEEHVVHAIKNVSLSVEKGSFVAIIGRNGSGKSTLAKNLNALMLPTEGTVYIKGMDTKNADLIWEIRQACGMVFQNPDNQLVSSIVEDDVAFGPENLGVEPHEIEETVASSLKSVGMYEHRTKGPHMLSGGQKQRIAIAGVIAMKPECIVLDEPTAMLDPKGRNEIMQIIKKLHDEGITVVLITHFMEEAAQAERVIIMNDGEIAFDGTPKEVFRHAEEIKALDLTVPLAVEIANGLRNKGIDIPYDIITEEELKEFLVNFNDK